MVFGGVHAGSSAANQFVGADLALPGKDLIAGRSQKRLEKMTKQRLAEMKLGGNLANGDC